MSDYKYSGMSYKNIYHDERYRLLCEKMRGAYQQENFLRSEKVDLQNGYIVTADSYGVTGGTDNISSHLFIQKCCLKHNEEIIFKYDSIYNMPRHVAAIIKHQNGRQYFLFKTDLYGLNVYDMESGSVYYYLPEGWQHPDVQICGESFIITDIHYNALNNMIAYGGCYWAGPCDVKVGDFTEPMNFNPRLKSMRGFLDPEYEMYDDIDFGSWQGEELHLLADMNVDIVVDVNNVDNNFIA